MKTGKMALGEEVRTRLRRANCGVCPVEFAAAGHHPREIPRCLLWHELGKQDERKALKSLAGDYI
ncbi:Thrombospondin-2 [Manis pentadactyla]|nr:Thrombospondin-2 [Manis pentadactyla]